MRNILILSVFLLLLTKSKGNTYIDEVEPEESEKQFIVEQHKNTIEILKSEMGISFGNLLQSLNLSETFNPKEGSIKLKTNSMEVAFANLSEIFSHKLATIKSQMEMSLANISEGVAQKLTANELKIESLERSFVNLSEILNSKIEMLLTSFSLLFNQNVSKGEAMVERSLSNLTETLNQKQIVSDSKMEKSLSNLSEAILNHSLTKSVTALEISVANLTEALNRKLTASDSKLNIVEKSLANISQILKPKTASDSVLEKSKTNFSHSMNQSLSKINMEVFYNMSSLDCHNLGFPVGVPVQEFNENFRTIYFGNMVNATSDGSSDRKYWILQELTPSSMWFSIRINNLGPNDHLTITGFSATGVTTRFDISSKTPIRTELTITGFFAFVELTINPGNPVMFHPSFIKLEYRTSETEVGTYRTYHSQMITREGLQYVSYPERNTAYTNNATSAILIAPLSRREFKITLKYLDTEGSLDYLKVFTLDGNSTCSSSSLKLRPDSTKKLGGLFNVTSQILGYSTAAVLLFHSDHSVVGTGYKVEIRPE